MKNNFYQKKVLITGALSLIGSHLAKRLVEYGAEVTSFTRASGDIRDYEKIDSLIQDKDIIFHLAGQSSVPVSMEDPFLDLDTNCKATLNILEACKKYNRRAKIVFSGTIRAADPTSIFDLHKFTSEKYLQIYHNVYGLPTTTLRLSNVFGDGIDKTDPHRSVINHIVKKALLEKSLDIYGNGGPLRDYNYVENVVEACLLAAQSGKTKGEYYIIGSGEGRSFKEVLETLQKMVKEMYGFVIEVKKIPTPELIKKTVQGDVIVDYTKFNQATGWRPKVSFEEGLSRTIEFYKK